MGEGEEGASRQSNNSQRGEEIGKGERMLT